MKQFKKKRLRLILSYEIIFSIFDPLSALAAVVPSNSRPSVTYGSTNEFGSSEANLGGTFGKSWGKTSTVEFTAQKGYIYELWSANKIKVEKYKYTYKPLLGSKKTLYSRANDRDGTYKWFFRYPRK